MVMVKPETLSERDRRLIVAARDAAKSAYAPYSGFAVGSAARSISGEITSSSNLENASLGLTVCAESGALAAANTKGQYDKIDAIAVVGHKFFPTQDSSQIVTPCGRCRQLISESAQLSGHDIQVFACSGDLQKIEKYRISELLPQAFGPRTIGTDDTVKSSSSSSSLRKLKISNP